MTFSTFRSAKTLPISTVVFVLLFGSLTRVLCDTNQWVYVYGKHLDHDYGYETLETSDGNYVFLGTVRDPSPPYNDVILVKKAPDGKTIWSYSYSDLAIERAAKIIEINDTDHSLILVGSESNSFGTKDYDVLLMKVKGNGELVFGKNFGENTYESGNNICETSDGSFLVVGTVRDASLTFFIFIVKLSNDLSTVLWGKKFGGAEASYAYDVIEASDGHYVVTGTFEVRSSFVMKFHPNGTLVWSKKIDTNSDSNSGTKFIVEDPMGGFIGVGQGYGCSNNTVLDIFIWKISNDGSALEWVERISSSEHIMIPRGFFRDRDGNYVISGYSRNATYNFPMVIKVTSDFETLLWYRTFSGPMSQVHSEFGGIAPTSDGGYIFAGNGYAFNPLPAPPQWREMYVGKFHPQETNMTRCSCTGTNNNLTSYEFQFEDESPGFEFSNCTSVSLSDLNNTVFTEQTYNCGDPSDWGEMVQNPLSQTFETQECGGYRLICEANCSLCLNETVCTTCSNGFFLHENDCTDDCQSIGSFFNDIDKCSPCEINCDVCVNATFCSTCTTGLFVTGNGTCTDNCGKHGSFFNDVDKCSKCEIPNCVACNALDNCTDCLGGYYGISCKPACSTNCTNCTTPTNCTRCENSFFLEAGECFPTPAETQEETISDTIADSAEETISDTKEDTSSETSRETDAETVGETEEDTLTVVDETSSSSSEDTTPGTTGSGLGLIEIIAIVGCVAVVIVVVVILGTVIAVVVLYVQCRSLKREKKDIELESQANEAASLSYEDSGDDIIKLA